MNLPVNPPKFRPRAVCADLNDFSTLAARDGYHIVQQGVTNNEPESLFSGDEGIAEIETVKRATYWHQTQRISLIVGGIFHRVYERIAKYTVATDTWAYTGWTGERIPWVDFTLASGWTKPNSSEWYARWRHINGQIDVECRIKKDTAGATGAISVFSFGSSAYLNTDLNGQYFPALVTTSTIRYNAASCYVNGGGGFSCITDQLVAVDDEFITSFSFRTGY